ncbi:MAG TPA: Wzz/FepE/Etk N-terminal domain-containing protein [Candidatus Lokiarchaeia archaeon]
MGKENMQNISELNLKSLFKILTKRKITFFIAFIVVFIAGLTLTFLVSPEYSSTSQITLSDNEIFYNDSLYKYFPGEADSLWIIPNIEEDQMIDYIVGKLDSIDPELKSDVILNNALNALQGKITKTQLIKSINISIDRWIGIVTIESYARTSDLAYNINKSILDSYVNQKKTELENAYNALLEKLDPEIELSKKEIAAFESEVEKETINLVLSKKIDIAFEKYDVLNTTRQNMVSNKNLFIDRIRVVKPTELIDVKNTSSYLRNILLSLIAAIVIGIIAVFSVNYFKNPKN